jgi:tRNA(Glu) U13 pseudouridine synthase TruD
MRILSCILSLFLLYILTFSSKSVTFTAMDVLSSDKHSSATGKTSDRIINFIYSSLQQHFINSCKASGRIISSDAAKKPSSMINNEIRSFSQHAYSKFLMNSWIVKRIKKLFNNMTYHSNLFLLSSSHQAFKQI